VNKPLLNPDQQQEQRQKKEKKKSSKLLENRGQHKEMKLLNPERRQRATPKTKKTHSNARNKAGGGGGENTQTAKSFHRNRSRKCARGDDDDDDDLRDLETVSRISMRTGILRSSEFIGTSLFGSRLFNFTSISAVQIRCRIISAVQIGDQLEI
jgi:hypothetical protein